jgi:hypothetical protein
MSTFNFSTWLFEAWTAINAYINSGSITNWFIYLKKYFPWLKDSNNILNSISDDTPHIILNNTEEEDKKKTE